MSNLSTYPTTMTPSHDNTATVVTIERSGEHQGKDKNSARDTISGNWERQCSPLHKCTGSENIPGSFKRESEPRVREAAFVSRQLAAPVVLYRLFQGYSPGPDLVGGILLSNIRNGML